MPTTTITDIASAYQDSIQEKDSESLVDTLSELFELGDRIIERAHWMEQFEHDNHLMY